MIYLLNGGIVRKLCCILMFVFLVGFLAGQADASINIFVWQHDNNLSVYDPVLRTTHTATAAIKRTLDNLNVDYDWATSLPEDLDQYDVVLTALSFYCPG